MVYEQQNKVLSSIQNWCVKNVCSEMPAYSSIEVEIPYVDPNEDKKTKYVLRIRVDGVLTFMTADGRLFYKFATDAHFISGNLSILETYPLVAAWAKVKKLLLRTAYQAPLDDDVKKLQDFETWCRVEIAPLLALPDDVIAIRHRGYFVTVSAQGNIGIRNERSYNLDYIFGENIADDKNIFSNVDKVRGLIEHFPICKELLKARALERAAINKVFQDFEL